MSSRTIPEDDQRVSKFDPELKYIAVGAVVTTGLLYILSGEIISGTIAITTVYSFTIIAHSIWFKTKPDHRIISTILLWIGVSVGVNSVLGTPITEMVLAQSFTLSVSNMYIMDHNRYLSQLLDSRYSSDEDEIYTYQGYLPKFIIRDSQLYFAHRLFPKFILKHFSQGTYVFIVRPFGTDNITFHFNSDEELLTEFTESDDAEYLESCECELCGEMDTCRIHNDYDIIRSPAALICSDCHGEVLDRCAEDGLINEQQVLVYAI